MLLTTLTVVWVAFGTAEAASPFQSDAHSDVFGYYMPAARITVGAFKLIDVALGPPEDFKKFERGDRFGGTWSPVQIEFAPVNAKMAVGEGGPAWEGTFRVLSTSYTVSRGQVSFTGTDKTLGAVSFRGTIDLAALQSERTHPTGGTGKVVMRGELVAGGRTYPNLAFTWFGGD